MSWLTGSFKDKNKALYEAIKEENLDKVINAIQRGADPNKIYPFDIPIFFESAKKNNIEIFKYLLDHGANIHIEFDTDNTKERSVHTLLAFYKPKEWLEILDKHGARWDGAFQDAIGFAAYGQNRSAMEFLIPKIDINHQTVIGVTRGPILHNAILNEDETDPDFIRFLLDIGANINGKDRDGTDQTPLMKSVNLYSELIMLLIEKGAELDLQDSNGNTALHLSVYYNNPDATEILVNARANQQIINNNGYTPLELAIERSNQKIISILGGGPIKIETAEHKGYLDIPAGTTNSISYEDIEDGDEVVVVFGKTNSTSHVYKREGLEDWFKSRRQQGQPLTNPMTNERITKQTDLTRYTARVVSKNNKQGGAKRYKSTRRRRALSKRTRRRL